jgi:DNA repair protein RadD
MFALRPHQAENLQQMREQLRTHRSVLLAAECGYGKGVITTHIIDGARKKGRHVLFMVYGKDRVNDMDERVTNLGIEHGVLMGSKRRERWHPVQVASVNTLHRMQHKPLGDLIVIDEAHLGLSPTFREVLDCYGNAKIIGLTATPMLGNGRALGVKSGGIFESMVKGPGVKQLIKEKSLVGSVVIAPNPPADLAGLKKKKSGEFDEEQGAAICDTSKVIGDIVDHWEKYSSDRKTVAFGFNQKHAFDIAESFRARGHNFAYVDANTPDGDIHTPGTRKFIWHQYDTGDLVGVAAVGVISIGWDHSAAKCLLLCSKTASFPLYRQRLGRGSRPHPGFDHFRIHDHTGNLFEFQDKGAFFESEIDWQLDGDPIKLSEEDKARRVYTCKTEVRIPEDGVPPGFTGPVENGWLLPCMQPFSPGPKRCPNCGIPLISNTKEIEVEAGELQEITQEMREAAEAKIRAENKRKAEYLDLVRLAKQKQYRSGYSQIVFKSKYGYWPPQGWKADVEFILNEPSERKASLDLRAEGSSHR